MTTAEQSFEEAVAEFLEKSREQLDQEAVENLPPWEPAPYDQSGPPGGSLVPRSLTMLPRGRIARR